MKKYKKSIGIKSLNETEDDFETLLNNYLDQEVKALEQKIKDKKLSLLSSFTKPLN